MGDNEISPAEPMREGAQGSQFTGDDVQKNKDIAAFSYLWIMSVVVYILKRESPFVRYHSKQGMLLFVLSVLVWFVPLIDRLLALVVLAGMVLGFIHAAQGQWKDVPLVGPVSRGEMSLRQAWQQIVDLAATFARSVSNMAKKSSRNSSNNSSTTPPPSPPQP